MMPVLGKPTIKYNKHLFEDFEGAGLSMGLPLFTRFTQMNQLRIAGVVRFDRQRRWIER